MKSRSAGERICIDWKISPSEYQMLEENFGLLIEHAAWDLYKKNTRNNHTDEQTDIAQELRMALIRAGSYYKRQLYIESCLVLCKQYAKDDSIINLVDSLQNLWNNKTRHGANRQKFGPEQEKILFQLTKKIVPKKERPEKEAILKIDSKFANYCKSITWNAQRYLGKKITKEKIIRSGQVSISEFDYLAI